MSRVPFPLRALLLAAATLFLLTGNLQAQVRSIQEFLNHQENFEKFTLTDYDWRLEGRFSIISGTTMTFPHCPVQFILTEEMVRNRGTTGVVEITGRLVKEDGKVVFKVASIASRPKDTERLRNMRLGIDATKTEEWFRIADWGHQRAKFYDDAALEREAAELDHQGVLTEFRRLTLDNEPELKALLQVAQERKIELDLRQQIQHKLFQARAVALRKTDADGQSWLGLQKDALQSLSGAETQLKNWPEDLAGRYRQHPVETYAASSQSDRRILHRIFVATIISDRITRDLKPDGSNGFQIADRLTEEVPDRRDLAESIIKDAIAYQETRLAKLNLSELDELCRRLEQVDRKAEVTQVKQKFLQARTPGYRQDGARGLSDLAELWMMLLNDTKTAAELYQEAWAMNNDYLPAREWLTAHGMQLVNGRWMTQAEVAAMPVPELEKAIREGRVEPGMTRQQVLSALGGAPSTQTRIATAQGVLEWWEYHNVGIVVRFGRSSRGLGSVVDKIDSLPAPREKTVRPE